MEYRVHLDEGIWPSYPFGSNYQGFEIPLLSCFDFKSTDQPSYLNLCISNLWFEISSHIQIPPTKCTFRYFKFHYAIQHTCQCFRRISKYQDLMCSNQWISFVQIQIYASYTASKNISINKGIINLQGLENRRR